MKLLTHDSHSPVKCLNSIIHSVTLLVSYFCPHRSLKTSISYRFLFVCACVRALCVCVSVGLSVRMLDSEERLMQLYNTQCSRRLL